MPGKRGTIKERLLTKIVEDENGCWMWQGSKSGTSGYGQIQSGGRGGKLLQAHRVAYEQFVGPIGTDENGDSLQLDHLCYDEKGYSNKLCVNPEHLEPATASVNYLRGYVEKKKRGWKHYTQKRKEQGEVE